MTTERGQSRAADVGSLEKALVDAGLEIYRTEQNEVQVAERIRLHIMDSGVRVLVAEHFTVQFTARSQRSDFPNDAADDLFARVRSKVGEGAGQRGYIEKAHATVEVKDPVDDNKVLDVWHEITYAKATSPLSAVVEEVRWALDVDKYVVG